MHCYFELIYFFYKVHKMFIRAINDDIMNEKLN